VPDPGGEPGMIGAGVAVHGAVEEPVEPEPLEALPGVCAEGFEVAPGLCLRLAFPL
jgi:hypothetical protein